MSLLIKALASAEKDKLAEQDKKVSGEYVVDEALTLELAPTEEIELEQTDELAKFVEETSNQKYEEDFDFVLPANHAKELLALEEEAGLDISELTPVKQSKHIEGANEHVAHQKTKSTGKSSSQTKTTPPLENSQKAAAKVFVANQSAQAPTSKMALAILGIAGALIVWLGLQGYNYLQAPQAPDVIIAKPVVQPATTIPENTAAAMPPQVDLANNTNADQNAPISNEPSSTTAVTNNSDANQAATKPINEEVVAKTESDTEVLIAENLTEKKTSKKRPSNNELSFKESSRKNTPIKLVSKPPSIGVDPTLLSAYQAFTRGDDSLAQQQYRQVLQHDVRNVDALLGMAAIAQRQGRNPDAMGWYQKVLEIEPKNTIAQSAITSPEAGADAATTESRIKSMLAQQPESANLHAALGHLFAEQSQWAQAQEAYFNASRYAPNNADYTFNLAISLDQLGKSSLALIHYQRALELVKKTNLASPDRTVLESRIQALQ